MGDFRQEACARTGVLDIYVGFTALYSLVLLSAGRLFAVNPEEAALFAYADYALCALFVAELVLRFSHCGNRAGFWKWAWLDLLACVPVLPFLRPLRALGLCRAFRSRRSRGGEGCDRIGAPLLAFLIFFSGMLVCAPAILFSESGEAEANIRTAGAAIWWVFETMSTVGYGDFFPVTAAGRCVGVLTMIFGVGTFGAITATILSLFKLDDNSALAVEVARLRLENERLKASTCAGAGESPAAKNGNGCNLAGNP